MGFSNFAELVHLIEQNDPFSRICILAQGEIQIMYRPYLTVHKHTEVTRMENDIKLTSVFSLPSTMNGK